MRVLINYNELQCSAIILNTGTNSRKSKVDLLDYNSYDTINTTSNNTETLCRNANKIDECINSAKIILPHRHSYFIQMNINQFGLICSL